MGPMSFPTHHQHNGCYYHVTPSLSQPLNKPYLIISSIVHKSLLSPAPLFFLPPSNLRYDSSKKTHFKNLLSGSLFFVLNEFTVLKWSPTNVEPRCQSFNKTLIVKYEILIISTWQCVCQWPSLQLPSLIWTLPLRPFYSSKPHFNHCW